MRHRGKKILGCLFQYLVGGEVINCLEGRHIKVCCLFFMLSAEHSEDSFREIYVGVMGKLPGWRQVVPPNRLSDPGLLKVKAIRSN